MKHRHMGEGKQSKGKGETAVWKHKWNYIKITCKLEEINQQLGVIVVLTEDLRLVLSSLIVNQNHLF